MERTIGAGMACLCGVVWWWMIWRRSWSVYSKTMKMHLSSRMISASWTTLGWSSSEHRDISRMADWERPVYWIASPSFSGLNLTMVSPEFKKEMMGCTAHFLMANSPLRPSLARALYTRPYVPLLMKPTMWYLSRTRTLLVYPVPAGLLVSMVSSCC